jgi:hypothetical protein
MAKTELRHVKLELNTSEMAIYVLYGLPLAVKKLEAMGVQDFALSYV